MAEYVDSEGVFKTKLLLLTKFLVHLHAVVGGVRVCRYQWCDCQSVVIGWLAGEGQVG